MRKPSPERFDKNLAVVVSTLTATEKADLYAHGTIPERLDSDQAKILRASIKDVYDESKTYPIYEGRVGASPRELKTVLLDAAQDPRFSCLSPVAVLDELDELAARTAEYEWLQQETLAGGYHDTRAFRDHCKIRLIDLWEDEFRVASGIVEERSWVDLFTRYVQHVSVWTKGEKVKNNVTGAYEDPDPTLMQHVEKMLGVKGDPADFRRGIISSIAAWSIDHPGQKVENSRVFPQHLKKLKEVTFEERKKAVADLCRQLVTFIEDEGKGLDAVQTRNAKNALERLETMGYCRNCARDAASSLLRWRLS
jgi:predicted Ser/Thr protein kinase